MERLIPFQQEHHMFREALGKFLDKEIVPYYEQWEKEHIIPHEVFEKFGAQGYLCMWLDEKYGGSGADFLYQIVETEELYARGLNALFTKLHGNIIAPYIYHAGTEEQKMKWLPKAASGEVILAVAMTEPGAGSDLAAMKSRAVLEGDNWVLNGSKTFISNGINADLFVVAAKTDTKAGAKGISLFLVEKGTPGFERGNSIMKIGLHAQDTVELFFDDCRIPKDCLLGQEGKGFIYLMEHLEQERLVAALGALAKAERSLKLTVDYVKERQMFGTTLSKFQNTQFELAKMQTEIDVAKSFVDHIVLELLAGRKVLREVSEAKYFCSELGFRVADRCLQLFGGYGYCEEYPIARMFVDSRIDRIYAGASEIMLTIVARQMGL